MVPDELQPGAPVGHESLQWRRTGTQGRRAEHERLLHGLFVLVEQHQHQAGAAAEAAEQGALADAGRGGDGIHGDRVGAVFIDQPTGGVEQ